MNNFFEMNSQIKRADWPYIGQNFLIFFLLITIGSFLFSTTGYFTYVIILSVFFLITTLFHLYRIQRDEMEYLQYKIQCINEINRLLPIRAPLPPMTGWAAAPELALAVQKTIQIHKPNLIVEIGSGITTLISAYFLEKYQPEGKIVSFEHDPTFAQKTGAELKLHQTDPYVELKVAPLVDIDIEDSLWRWYDLNNFRPEKPIDLLIIDGPPEKTQNYARFPALPVLYKFLSKHAVIIMDDTDRKMEAETVVKWLLQFPDLIQERTFSEKGITVIHRQA